MRRTVFTQRPGWFSITRAGSTAQPPAADAAAVRDTAVRCLRLVRRSGLAAHAQLRNVPLSPRIVFRHAFRKLQVERARAHDSVLQHHAQSLRAALTEPEMLNPVIR